MMENTEVKIFRDFNVETDRVIVRSQPHIAVVEKKEKNALLIDIAVPGQLRVYLIWSAYYLDQQLCLR